VNNLVYILITVLAISTVVVVKSLKSQIDNLQEQLQIGCGMEEVTDEVDS
jgi:hypothetical protein